MKIVQINSVLYGSTGNIMKNLTTYGESKGHTMYMAVPKGRHNHIDNDNSNLIGIGNRFSEDLHIILSRLTDLNGYFSYLSTKEFLNSLSTINPDIIHLHNLHSSYINLGLLFSYLKNKTIPVLWTLHDCWAFTGHCTHFLYDRCLKWQTKCKRCSCIHRYPKSYLDMSSLNFKMKKKWFTGINSCTIVTPSIWLADIVNQSFLKEYDIKIINNGIDLDIFKPHPSNIDEKLGIEKNKKIILGVSNSWNARKGIDIFYRISKELPKERFQIVLVGCDKNTKKDHSLNIKYIENTRDQNELAALYSLADVFVNPTREDNYPTVNMEAIACGTPIITFDSGGSPEILKKAEYGYIVPQDDISGIIRCIKKIVSTSSDRDEISRRAKRFDKNLMFKQYFELYENITHLS